MVNGENKGIKDRRFPEHRSLKGGQNNKNLKSKSCSQLIDMKKWQFYYQSLRKEYRSEYLDHAANIQPKDNKNYFRKIESEVRKYLKNINN